MGPVVDRRDDGAVGEGPAVVVLVAAVAVVPIPDERVVGSMGATTSTCMFGWEHRAGRTDKQAREEADTKTLLKERMKRDLRYEKKSTSRSLAVPL